MTVVGLSLLNENVYALRTLNLNGYTATGQKEKKYETYFRRSGAGNFGRSTFAVAGGVGDSGDEDMSVYAVDKTELFPYQELSAAFLAARRFALLADEPRVGKTPAVIEACDRIGAKNILVVCPAVARADWVRKFYEYSIFAHQAYPMFSRGRMPANGVVVTSYALVDKLHYRRHQMYDVLILDESHYLKSAMSKRSADVLGHNGLIQFAKRTWFVTGTPAPNNAAEMWLMLHVCGVYRGDYAAFTREFCTGYIGDYGFNITGSKNQAGLKALLSDFMMRRTLAEVRPDIPSIEFSDYAVTYDKQWIPEFPPEEQRIHDRLDAAIAAGEDPVKFLSSNTSQMATLRRHIGLMKVEPMAQRVRMLNLPKLIVFAYHTDVIAQLAERLPEHHPVMLTGETPERTRAENIRRFKEDPTCRLFIGQITAAGTNIDLSVANYSCIMEPDYVPGNNTQAARRMQNVNKVEPTFCEFIGLANSVDEKISKIYRRKTIDISTFIDNRGKHDNDQPAV